METRQNKTFTQRLLNVQHQLKAPKDQKNTFGNFNYRSAEDILQAVKPILYEEGLGMTITDEIVDIGGRIYVKSTVTVSGEDASVSTCGWARESSEIKKGMDASQMTGSCSSYARKYALNGMFLIDDSRLDPDSNESTKKRLEEETQDTDPYKRVKDELRACRSRQEFVDTMTRWKPYLRVESIKAVCQEVAKKYPRQ